MTREQIIQYWRTFFTDLLLGTAKNLFRFCSLGFILGLGVLWFWDARFLEPAHWNIILEWTAFLLGVAWYGILGPVHGAIACFLFVAGKKLSQMFLGLHDLLDLFSKEVFKKTPKFGKNIPKDELEKTFDEIGKGFLESLKLKKGVFFLVVRLVYGLILKALKFIFLNDVLAELQKKPGEEVTPSDVESAVRRVSVEILASPIHDYFLLTQILNIVLIICSFGFPIGFFIWLR